MLGFATTDEPLLHAASHLLGAALHCVLKTDAHGGAQHRPPPHALPPAAKAGALPAKPSAAEHVLEDGALQGGHRGQGSV